MRIDEFEFRNKKGQEIEPTKAQLVVYIKALHKDIKELEEQLYEERGKLQQVYSRLGVEAFGEDIHEQALKELGKVIPKFNIRQEVWIEWRGKIINVTVESIHIYIGEIIEYNLKSDRYFIPRWEDEVFYTKEEAQEKLKEMEKDEYKRNDTKRN